MAKGTKRKFFGIALVSFIACFATITYVARSGYLTPQEAGLMVVATFGMHVGFGILIAVYRLINRLG